MLVTSFRKIQKRVMFKWGQVRNLRYLRRWRGFNEQGCKIIWEEWKLSHTQGGNIKESEIKWKWIHNSFWLPVSQRLNFRPLFLIDALVSLNEGKVGLWRNVCCPAESGMENKQKASSPLRFNVFSKDQKILSFPGLLSALNYFWHVREEKRI